MAAKRESQERPSFGLLRLLLFVAPAAAGAGVGALINKALVDATLANRFWQGAGVSPGPAPREAAVNVLSILGAVVLWLLLSVILKREGTLPQALEREGLAFVPALSILVLAALDNSGLIPGIMMYSIHAVIFSVAAFAALNVLLFASRREPPFSKCLGAVDNRALTFVLAGCGLYFVTFFAMGCLQYDALNISYTDTADWEQMLWNTLRGRFLETSAFPHMFFGEHVQFVHLLLLPFYWLVPTLKTLMFFKSAALASGAIPVYLLAVRRLKSKPAGVAFAFAYLLYPAMQYTDLELVYNTFRPETFAIPALLWAVYFLDVERIWGLLVAAFLAMASKEEMALPVMMMGFVLLSGKKRGWGLLIAAGALVWFVVSVFFVIPYFREGASHMTRYYQDFWNSNDLGGLTETSLAGVVWNMLKNPLYAVMVALRPVKIDYLLLLFVPLGLRPLLSRRMLFVMLPSLATTLLASRDPSFTIYYHYQISLVPFMVMGAIYGAEVSSGILARFRFIFGDADEGSRSRAALAACTVLVLTSSVAGNVLLAKSPISLPFHNPNMQTYWRHLYVSTEKSRLFFKEVAPLVPEGASVCATEFAANALAGRRDIYVFPDRASEMDYLVIDVRDRWLSLKLAEQDTAIEKVLATISCDTLFNRAGFLVLKTRKTPQNLTAPQNGVD